MTTTAALHRLERLKRHWSTLLQTPAWYQTVAPELRAFTDALGSESGAVPNSCKESLYDFFEEHLRADDFYLGQQLGYFDVERRAIDTVVIHHTSRPPSLTPERLSAIELMRLYSPYFANPPATDAALAGKALFSGHARNGKQVFWPYHWIVRMDGSVERLLSDQEIGWHAGNWEINCRSAGIALDNDYEHSKPSDLVLQSTAVLLARHYEGVPISRVFGHREINPKTLCPSSLLLSGSSSHGWKNDLIDRILKEQHLKAA